MRSQRTLTIGVAACALIAVSHAPAVQPPLTAAALPAAAAFTSKGERGITRRVFLQSKIGLVPRSSAKCDGTTLARPPARTGAVEGLYVTKDNRVALIETVYRYASVSVARQAVTAYAAVAGCGSLENGWVGFTPRATDVEAVPSSTVVGDQSAFLKAREPVAGSKTASDLHLAILRSGAYVILTQNFRDTPLDAASLPALAALGRTQLAALRKGT